MRASEWLKTLPRGGPSPEREAMVIDAVRQQNIVFPDWCEVRTEARGHHGIFYVGADTLRVGEPGDSIRIMVSAKMWQEIADMFEWTMPTVKMCDLIHSQAKVHVEPYLTPGNAQMDYYVDDDRKRADDRMVHVNAEIDKRIARRPGLASSFHKDWALSTRWKYGAGACNYGCFSHNGPSESHSGERCWQPLSTRHNMFHLDDSQQLRPILNHMLIDNEIHLVADVLTHSDFAELMSDEGALPFSRHPGTTPLQSLSAGAA